MTTIDEERVHLRIWETLSWVANGTASEADIRIAQEHLCRCELCRVELAHQHRLCREMNSHTQKMPPVERGLENLLLRIEDDERGAAVQRVSPPWRRRTPESTRMIGANPIAYALGAFLVIEAGSFAVLGTHWRGDPPRAEYATLSQRATPVRGATIRLVVDGQMTVVQLQSMLVSLHLRIVDGPSENGVYSLTPVSASSDVTTQITTLRSVPGVRFAEPIAGASDGS